MLEAMPANVPRGFPCTYHSQRGRNKYSLPRMERPNQEPILRYRNS